MYPTEDAEANLRAIVTLQKEFPGVPIGYSDHTRGVDACVAAVALGAKVIEKHITYHVRMPGTDHEGGMTPEDLAEMVRRIGRLENMMGSGEKVPAAREREILSFMRAPMTEAEFRL
jgi:sialic acid synthase SpsE